MNSQEQQLLKSAANEIMVLRTDNHNMRLRLDMFDQLMILFNTKPEYQSQGMSPDLVWEIEKHIAQSENKGLATKEPS